MMNNYVSKEIIERASRASCFAKFNHRYLAPEDYGKDDFSVGFWFNPEDRAKPRTPMERAVVAYRATWGWLVIAALLAAGILAVLSAIYE